MGVIGTISTEQSLKGSVVYKNKVNGNISGIQPLSGIISSTKNINSKLSCNETITGTVTVATISVDHYTGSYTITPKAFQDTVLNTANKYLDRDVHVHEIPYFEVSNINGTTVYIGNEV